MGRTLTRVVRSEAGQRIFNAASLKGNSASPVPLFTGQNSSFGRSGKLAAGISNSLALTCSKLFGFNAASAVASVLSRLTIQAQPMKTIIVRSLPLRLLAVSGWLGILAFVVPVGAATSIEQISGSLLFGQRIVQIGEPQSSESEAHLVWQ